MWEETLSNLTFDEFYFCMFRNLQCIKILKIPDDFIRRNSLKSISDTDLGNDLYFCLSHEEFTEK